MTDQARQMVAVAAALAGVTFNTLKGKCRRRPLPICRYLVAQELVRQGLSTIAAGRAVNIHHSTVLHGREALEKITEANGYQDTDELFIIHAFPRLINDL